MEQNNKVVQNKKVIWERVMHYQTSDKICLFILYYYNKSAKSIVILSKRKGMTSFFIAKKSILHHKIYMYTRGEDCAHVFEFLAKNKFYNIQLKF